MEVVGWAIGGIARGGFSLDASGEPLGKGLLQIGDVDVYKALQVADVAVVIVVVSTLGPRIDLLIDAPLAEVLRLSLPDS